MKSDQRFSTCERDQRTIAPTVDEIAVRAPAGGRRASGRLTLCLRWGGAQR